MAERRQHFDSVSEPLNRLLHLDLKTSLVDSLLLLTDKMSMATSLEARVPFLDHELIETIARVPPRLKVKGTRLRYLQKQAMRGRLPEEVFRRKKRGFGCPVGRWFRSELREMLHDTLSAAQLQRDGLFEPVAITSMIAAHEEMKDDWSEALLALLTFQIWKDRLHERSLTLPRRLYAEAAL